jgi:hypothetical protein
MSLIEHNDIIYNLSVYDLRHRNICMVLCEILLLLHLLQFDIITIRLIKKYYWSLASIITLKLDFT